MKLVFSNITRGTVIVESPSGKEILQYIESLRNVYTFDSKVSLLEILPNRKKLCTKMFILEFSIIVKKINKGRKSGHGNSEEKYEASIQ